MKRLPLPRRFHLAITIVVLTAVACGESPVSPDAASPDLFFVGPKPGGTLPPPTSDHDQIWVTDPETGQRLDTVLVCNDTGPFHTSIRVNYLLNDQNNGTDSVRMLADPRVGDLSGIGVDLFVGDRAKCTWLGCVSPDTLITPGRTRMLVGGRVWRDVAYANVKLPKGQVANDWDPLVNWTDQWYIRVLVNGWDQYSDDAITVLADQSACQ